MESFNKTLKNEGYYVKFYRSERYMKDSIKDYINFYNSYRIHSYNNDKTPDEKEALFYSQNQAEYWYCQVRIAELFSEIDTKI